MIKKTNKIIKKDIVPDGYDEFLKEIVGLIHNARSSIGNEAEVLKDLSEHFDNDLPVSDIEEFEAKLTQEKIQSKKTKTKSYSVLKKAKK